MVTRYLIAIAAGFSALSGVLAAYPGDLVAQEWLIATTAAAAFLNAIVFSLTGETRKK